MPNFLYPRENENRATKFFFIQIGNKETKQLKYINTCMYLLYSQVCLYFDGETSFFYFDQPFLNFFCVKQILNLQSNFIRICQKRSGSNRIRNWICHTSLKGFFLKMAPATRKVGWFFALKFVSQCYKHQHFYFTSSSKMLVSGRSFLDF